MSNERDIAKKAGYILKEVFVKTALTESVLYVEKDMLFRKTPSGEIVFIKQLSRDDISNRQINRKGIFKVKKLVNKPRRLA
ncbi:hypothetical protein QDT05_03025 [Acinetobacter baumannii]|uniref:hypothetical protein n=1 Tax=Acinetobacter baumannii TaxID=470 RepID=UPI0024495D04|nr:hypothetical protein [Acinetobacter baumannii]MDH2601867.1 hypothetical protein [Acinetobacter baumannii]MDN8245403.1 hypothetical protein [Acinetobacter baumannii]